MPANTWTFGDHITYYGNYLSILTFLSGYLVGWVVYKLLVFDKSRSTPIKSSLLLFVRKEDEQDKFYVYEPTSPSDPTPKVVKVPNFNKSTNFLVRIPHAYNKSLSFPVGIEIDYRGNFYTTKNSSGLF